MKVVLGMFAAVTLSLTGCATDEEYYEGEVVPTRPVGKPSLDPTQPAELTGSQESDSIPDINESTYPGQAPKVDRYDDGTIQWADNLTVDGRERTFVHNPNYGTGIDHVEVLDENGTLLEQYDTRIDPDQVDTNVVRR